MPPDNLPTLYFKTSEAWAAWLEANHKTAPGVWFKMYKKATGLPTLSHDQALDVALCYGWIDAISHRLDEQAFVQKFVPRGPKSLWSKINIGHIDRLTKEGKMKPAGLAAVAAAKADGRWAQAYDSPANMKMPEDFLKAVAQNPKTKAFFDTLNKDNTYAIAWRLQTAKKPETRVKRMKALLEMLERGEKIH